MKKIMFSTEYGLQQGVIARTQTMTRRVDKRLNHPLVTEISDWGIDDKGKCYLTITYSTGLTEVVYPAYHIGEEIAVAQSYKSIVEQDPDNDYGNYYVKQFRYAPGWTNKMFVRADLMPHRIRITDIRVERLQDISDEDCIREGIVPVVFRQWHKQELTDFSPQKYTDRHGWTLEKFRDGIEDPWEDSEPGEYMAETAQVAFAVLIDKISGKGTWKRNPWVFVYEFELIK